MGVSGKVVGACVQKKAIFEIALISKASDDQNTVFVDLGSGAALARSQGTEHINLRRGNNRFPQRLQAIKVALNVEALDGEQMVVLLENADSAEDVDPLLIKCATCMVVTSFTHLRKF